MITRLPQKELRSATWARRLAVFFIQLLILTVILHRFFSLTTPAAINLLAVSGLGLLVALLMAAIALWRIWYGDYLGSGQAVSGLLVALVGLAPFAYYGALGLHLPALTDVETSPRQPIPFKDLSVRPPDANPIKTPTLSQIEAQEAAYPAVHPMEIDRGANEAFALVRLAMHHLHWHVVDSEPPGLAGKGYMQATARTLIMGYTDDVAVRVTGNAQQSSLDVRSVSRYGRTDFGQNAKRIQALFDEVKADIEKGERPALQRTSPNGAPPMPPRPAHPPRRSRR
jgi:uncharacterized protein (DUF1499 family)